MLRDERRPARGGRRSIAACGQLSVPKAAGDRRARELRRPGLPHRRMAPRRRPRGQARGDDRHRAAARSRSSRGSSRSSSSSTSTSARPGWTIPKMDYAYSERAQRLFERFPIVQRARPRGDVRVHGAGDLRAHEPALAARRPSARSGAADHKAIDDEAAAREGHAGGRDRLQADHAHRRVVSDARRRRTSSCDRPDRRGHRDRRAAAGRTRARGGRARARDRLREPRVRRADGGRRCRRPQPRGGVGAASPRAYLGLSVPELPEHVPDLRAEHERRRGLGDLHDRGGRQPRDRGARRARARTRAAHRGAPRGARRRSTASSALRSPGRSGTPAARAGTSTRTATIRASGRGCGAPTGNARPRSTRTSTRSAALAPVSRPRRSAERPARSSSRRARRGVRPREQRGGRPASSGRRRLARGAAASRSRLLAREPSHAITAAREKRHFEPKRRPGSSPASAFARTASFGRRRSSAASASVSTSSNVRMLADLDPSDRELLAEQLADDLLLAPPGAPDEAVERRGLLLREPYEQRYELIGHTYS